MRYAPATGMMEKTKLTFSYTDGISESEVLGVTWIELAGEGGGDGVLALARMGKDSFFGFCPKEASGSR